MASSLLRLSVLFCALSLALVGAGCGDDDGPSQMQPEPDAAFSCVDNDGDFHFTGPDCVDGDDCDDTDPEITDECHECEDYPQSPGCPCDPQPGIVCEPPPIPHAEGMLVCREGAKFCRDGAWTECEAQGEYVLIRN